MSLKMMDTSVELMFSRPPLNHARLFKRLRLDAPSFEQYLPVDSRFLEECTEQSIYSSKPISAILNQAVRDGHKDTRRSSFCSG
jgi:hypothetical protein